MCFKTRHISKFVKGGVIQDDLQRRFSEQQRLNNNGITGKNVGTILLMR